MAKLLNPHGSDETHTNTSASNRLYIFLTHTVQMKPYAPALISTIYLPS